MPVAGTLPAARPHRRAMTMRRTAAPLFAVLWTAACGGERPAHVVMSEATQDGSKVALVRLVPCDAGWCESLWIGATPDAATRVVTLPRGEEHCDEIAWTRDGARVAFLINGYQLRLYDARSHAPAGLVDLVPADARPTSRLARGLTFSDSGAAITFDDCPRGKSGCKPGMLAIR